jgi:hypothetical protein
MNWALTDTRPRSISGTAVNGEKLMRFVYLDESGTSSNEQIAVVAGVIINADLQWKRVEEYIDNLIRLHVPLELRDGFTFHGTDLFSWDR